MSGYFSIMEENEHSCACGCGRILRGSREYFPGHKPKRVRKTKEERSAIAKARWDGRRVERIVNLCACGCGGTTKGMWVKGHHSRVENVSRRADVREKRSVMFLRLHAEGKLGEAWNKGLTKEQDSRLVKCGRPVDVLSDEERQFRSEEMKKRWKDGSIVPFTGSSHSQWKGGTSSITQRLRGHSRMYKEWKLPILQRDGFECTVCHRGALETRLAVHHDKERFAAILHLFVKVDGPELTWEQETEVVEKVVDYHVQERVSGVTLCHDCHAKVHEKDVDVD